MTHLDPKLCTEKHACVASSQVTLVLFSDVKCKCKGWECRQEQDQPSHLVLHLLCRGPEGRLFILICKVYWCPYETVVGLR